jgi:bifunctional DNA-binding transcriptional regulator/antitoxin component of YhaV-PrlF toxin-antitoxin module
MIYKYEEIFHEIPGDTENIMMTIPPEICEKQGWKEGDVVHIEVKDNCMVISKV